MSPENHPRASTYAQTARLRWTAFGLGVLVTFVLLANASQTKNHKPVTASNETEHVATPVEALAFVDPENRKTALPEGNPASLWKSEKKHTVKKILVPFTDPPPAEEPAGESKKYTIKNGDTLSGILDHYNVHSSLSELLAIKAKIAPLLDLKPGNSLKLTIEDAELTSLVYEITQTEQLEITLENGRYQATRHLLAVEKREAYAFGIITNSFYQAGLKAGLSDKVIVNIANILGWDIDFGLDVRKGDYFSVIYEEEYVNGGEKLRDGDILAIEFINDGKAYRVIRYIDLKGKKDYFSPSGKNVRKPFLRNPIEYARISSHFNPRRLHPIFKTVRPHRGIDYAAPHGTPVRATGDGKVLFSGRKTGYGNVVIVNHGRVYSTLYAHLSRMARGARAGSRVRQGQVIGYVGATGYATGPHLHYEFRISGVHKNPLTVKLPDSKPLPGGKMPRFRQSILPELEKLDTLKSAYTLAE